MGSRLGVCVEEESNRSVHWQGQCARPVLSPCRRRPHTTTLPDASDQSHQSSPNSKVFSRSMYKYPPPRPFTALVTGYRANHYCKALITRNISCTRMPLDNTRRVSCMYTQAQAGIDTQIHRKMKLSTSRISDTRQATQSLAALTSLQGPWPPTNN